MDESNRIESSDWMEKLLSIYHGAKCVSFQWPVTVKARLLKNDIITVDENDRMYVARPHGWDEKGLVSSLKRVVTLKYHIFDGDENEISTVDYDFLHDSISIVKGGIPLQLKSSKFSWGGKKYHIEETPLKFAIYMWSGSDMEVVAEGRKLLTTYTLQFVEYTNDLEDIFMELVIGYLIRRLANIIGF